MTGLAGLVRLGRLGQREDAPTTGRSFLASMSGTICLSTAAGARPASSRADLFRTLAPSIEHTVRVIVTALEGLGE